tara:strand:+ start:20039 stop:20272 length:234 start_codon:yes stop_codon:yes gene_type:complete
MIYVSPVKPDQFLLKEPCSAIHVLKTIISTKRGKVHVLNASPTAQVLLVLLVVSATLVLNQSVKIALFSSPRPTRHC